MTPWGMAQGAAGIGSGLMGLFGHNKNPADEANKYISQIPGQTGQYYDPWIQSGQRQLPELENQYHQGMTDPGGRLNQIGQGFHESPGFKFAMQQALQGSNHLSGANGMYGSPQHEQQNMQLATDLGNQEYDKWIQNALGIYGQGLQGAQGMTNQGQQAGQSRADMIAQALAQQGNYAYEGQAQKNQNKGNAFGNILGGVTSMFF